MCSPFFGDQLANGRYVEDVWEIGTLLVGKMERGEIEHAIAPSPPSINLGGVSEERWVYSAGSRSVGRSYTNSMKLFEVVETDVSGIFWQRPEV